MVNQRVEAVNQEIHMSNRAQGYVTGVMDVISFDLEDRLVILLKPCFVMMDVEKFDKYPSGEEPGA